MSKKKSRKQRATEATAAPPENSLTSTLQRLALPIFLALLAAYLIFFVTAPAPDRLRAPPGEDQLTRIDMVLWLTLVKIGELPSDWTGGNVGSVSLLDRASVLAVAGLILLVTLIIGWLLIDVTHAACGFAKLELFVFSLAVGLNALSLLTLVIGLLGQLQNPLAYAVPIAITLILAAWRCVGQVWRPARSCCSSRAGLVTCPTDWLPRWVLWLAAPFVVIILAGAILPPREFDVREYHLQAPKEWFQQGAVTFMPHNVYANMPLGPEILSLPAMAVMPGDRPWWWGALAGKAIIASYSVITMLALFAAGRRFFNTTAGVVAALVYISIPWIALVSIAGYVDGALACNLFLAVYATMIWQQETRARRASEGSTDDVRRGFPCSRFGLVLLSGFLAGAAVSCKYTGVVFAAIPLAVWIFVAVLRTGSQAGSRQEPKGRPKNHFAPHLSPFHKGDHRGSNKSGSYFSAAPKSSAARERIRRLHWTRGLLCVGVFLIAVLAGCGLWLGKNWVLAGNPTYPLAYGVFGGQTRTPEKARQWRSAHAVPTNEHGQRYSLPQIGAAAIDVAINNQWPSPILFPLAALAYFVPQHRRTVWLVFGWLAFILAIWFLLTHRIDRFWIPALPLAALLAGAGATWRSDILWRATVAGILGVGLLWNLLVVAGMLAPPKLLVDLSSLQNDPDRVHPAHIYLNKHVPEGKRVLLVGDAEPFDLQVPALYNTCFDDSVFEQLMKDKSKPQRIAALRERNISQVFVHWGEVQRYRNTYGFTDYVTPDVFRELVEQGVLQSPHVVNDPQSGAPVGEVYAVSEVNAAKN